MCLIREISRAGGSGGEHRIAQVGTLRPVREGVPGVRGGPPGAASRAHRPLAAGGLGRSLGT